MVGQMDGKFWVGPAGGRGRQRHEFLSSQSLGFLICTMGCSGCSWREGGGAGGWAQKEVPRSREAG